MPSAAPVKMRIDEPFSVHFQAAAVQKNAVLLSMMHSILMINIQTKQLKQ